MTLQNDRGKHARPKLSLELLDCLFSVSLTLRAFFILQPPKNLREAKHFFIKKEKKNEAQQRKSLIKLQTRAGSLKRVIRYIHNQ